MGLKIFLWLTRMFTVACGNTSREDSAMMRLKYENG